MSKQEILISSPAQFEAFLEHATNPWEPGCEIKTAVLSNSTAVSCVLWDGMFYISGTDIVKALVYRFETSGRVIRNMKKFEEGVFSDLRNLKPGKDASLEEPRSEFLEFLHRNHCIRTQKKQKVFHWMAVPHEKLLQDSLDREIKRENDPELGLDATGNFDGSVVISSALTHSSSSSSLHLDASSSSSSQANGHQRKRSLGNEIGSGKKIRQQQGQSGKVVKAGSRRNSVKSSAASSRRTSTSSSPEEDNLEEEDGSSEDEAAAQLYQHSHQHLSYQHPHQQHLHLHHHHQQQQHGIYRSASASSLLSTASMTPLTSSPMFASSAPSSRPSSRPSSAPSTPAISSLYSMHLSSPFIHSYFTPAPPSLVSLGSTDSLNQHLEEATIYHSGSSSPYSSPLQDYSTNPAELYQEQEDGGESTSAFDPLGQTWGDEPKEALVPSKEQLSCQFSIPSNACPTPPSSSSVSSSTSTSTSSASSASSSAASNNNPSSSAAHLRSHEEAADACGGDDDSSFPTGGVAAHTHSTHTLDPVLSVRSAHPSVMKFQAQIPQHFNASAGQGAAFRPFSVNYFTQYEHDYSYDIPTVIPSFVNQPSVWTNSYELPTSQLQQQGAPHVMAQGQPQHPNTTARGARPQQVSFGPY